MYKNNTIKYICLAMYSLSCIKIIVRGEKPSKCVCARVRVCVCVCYRYVLFSEN